MEERGLKQTKSRKNSEDIEFSVKLKQIMTQPISESLLANKEIVGELKSPVAKSFKIELNDMVQDSRDKRTVHEEKMEGVLTFSNRPKARKVSYQEALASRRDRTSKSPLSRFYDADVANRAKRNSLKIDNIA